MIFVDFLGSIEISWNVGCVGSVMGAAIEGMGNRKRRVGYERWRRGMGWLIAE